MLVSKSARAGLRVLLISSTLSVIVAAYSVVWASPSQQGIVAGTASTMTYAGGMVTVDVPATAPVEAGTLSYVPMAAEDAPASAPAGTAFASTLFELSVLDANSDPIVDYSLGASITISVKYTDDDLQAADGNPGRLILQKYDTVLQAWTALNTAFDPATGTVRAQSSRLGFFALIGQELPPTPTPTATATLLPGVATSTPTAEPPTPTAEPTATLLPPAPGDVTPGSGMLIGLLVLAFVLIASGGYYLRQSKQS